MSNASQHSRGERRSPKKAAATPPERRRKTARSGALATEDTLDRSDWIAAARRAFIRGGVSAVKVDKLAKTLKVTRGGFYWRFDGRPDLLDALVEDWRATNSSSMLAALRGPGTPMERFRSLMDVWISEKGFDPAFDMAMRDWARVSPKVAKIVGEVDDERIEAFHQLFLAAGYSDDEAFIRARIVYFHQVGYYAMGVKEERQRRMTLAEIYFKVLTGFS